MNAETFLKQFAYLAEAPNGISKLRELILQLAVRGKLVPQDPNDEPASELLKRIQAEKQRLIDEGEVPKPRSSQSVEGASGESSFAVPDSWKWSTLDAVSCYIQRGKGPKYVEQSPIPVVSQKCIQWRGFTMEPARFIDPASLDKYGSERLLRTGDLLWNSTGTGTIGRVNVYDHDVHYYEKVVADSHVTVVRPLFANPHFIWTYLASPDVQEGFEDRASGSTNQIELSTSAVRGQSIPIPPLAEQERIVTKVDELMALCDKLEIKQQVVRTKQIALNRASLHALTEPNKASLATAWHRVRNHFDHLYTSPKTVSELRQTILQLAVMGRLVSQEPNDEPASELLKKIQVEKHRLIAEGLIRKPKPFPSIDSKPPFELPGGWAFTRLLDVSSDVHYGYTASANASITATKLLRITDIQNDSVDWDSVPGCEIGTSGIAKYALHDGDIVIARTGGTIGKSYLVVSPPQKAVFASYLIRIIPTSPTEPRFLKLFLGSPTYWGQLHESSKGTGQPNVNATSLKGLLLSLPPLAEQKRIVAKVDELMSLCDDLEAKLQQSQTDADNLLTAIVHELTESSAAKVAR